MQGKGRTVFAGGKIEEFDVEFLAVIKNAFPKRDMILARLEGGPLERTGVIAGMSGSPIYAEGRLVGAVAYTWSFTKEAVAGIVPISDMVGLLSVEEEGLGPAQGPEALQPALSVGRREGAFQPLAVPVCLSGFSAGSVEALGGLWEQWGAIPIQVGSLSRSQADEFRLEPGACVGVALIRGDMSMVVGGTLTYVSEGKFAAFGHQFAGVGPTCLPLVAGYVHTVIPRQDLSIRIAGDGGVIGNVSQDRAAGIAGTITSDAAMIPAVVRVGTGGGRRLEYVCEIAGDPRWQPELIEALALSAFTEAERSVGEATVRADLEMDVERLGTLRFGNIFYSGDRPLEQIASSMRVARDIMANPFGRVKFRRVLIEVSLTEGHETARISQVVASKPTYAPGEKAAVFVTLEPYSGPSVVRQLEFAVPGDAVGGSEVQIDVCDARTNEELASNRRPGIYRPANLGQYIDLLKRRPTNSTLCGRMLVQRAGVSINGTSFPSLPGSLLPVLGARVRSGVNRISGEVTGTLETPWYLSGSQTITLRIAEEGAVP